MKYYSTINKNELLIYATTWMIPKYNMSNKRSQNQGSTYTLTPFIGNPSEDKTNLYM